MSPQDLDSIRSLDVAQAWAFLIPIAMSIISQIAANKAKNREAKNVATAQENQDKGDDYRTQQQAMINALLGQSRETSDFANIDLDRRKFALDAPSTRGRQALAGSLLANLKPATMTGGSPQMLARMPQISGGLTPAAISPQAKQMGMLMQLAALQGQQAGDKFDPLQRTNFMGGILPGPQRAGMQDPSRTESLLGLIGGIGNAAYTGYQGWAAQNAAQQAAQQAMALNNPSGAGGYSAINFANPNAAPTNPYGTNLRNVTFGGNG